MITRDNVREVFDAITEDQIERVMESKKDYSCILAVKS